ncbi:AT-hook motif nuclear-localized protein 7 isoform X2 [Physcomitrium patens]|nr:AT-hook motif nuclear-localized protein 7-like isoform X2 [Physcomitrium patens]|eukprot:XP_024373055.1 AT-hook motif nuclear-localized protein 7-like isoform X2 [Physcomitrella patens]
MSSPQRGGMAGGFAQGLHTPALVRHQPPPSSLPAISLSQGAQVGAPGMSTSVFETGPVGPHPRSIIAARPPSSSGINMGMIATPIVGAGGETRGEQPPKRKRGRPRKFATGGELSSGALGSVYPVLPALMPASSSPYTPSPEKRGRGRPPGSGKKQQLAALGVVLAGTGQGFTPHILTVSTGEDVSTRIMQFAQHGPRAMCVLSANGAISNVTLRQQSSSGGTVTYEGRYEILSLTGSYLSTELGGGARQRTGGLSVSLAGSDGRVIGGGVAGMLTAASPIQVVVASFLSDTFKAQAKGESPLGSTPGGSSGAGSAPGSTPGSALGGQRPPTARSEPKTSSALGPRQVSPVPPPTGQVSVQRPQVMSMFQPMAGWQPAVPGDGRRTDINISLPGG